MMIALVVALEREVLLWWVVGDGGGNVYGDSVEDDDDDDYNNDDDDDGIGGIDELDKMNFTNLRAKSYKTLYDLCAASRNKTFVEIRLFMV